MGESNHWLTDDLYRLGVQQSKVLSSGASTYRDLLHDTILSLSQRVEKGKLDPSKITKGLLFISMKNLFLNQKLKEGSRNRRESEVTEQLNYLNDLEYSELNDKRMESVSGVYESLNSVEKEFFLLRFVNRSNKKIISTKLNLSSLAFNEMEDSIKTKIKEEYNGKTQKDNQES